MLGMVFLRWWEDQAATGAIVEKSYLSPPPIRLAHTQAAVRTESDGSIP